MRLAIVLWCCATVLAAACGGGGGGNGPTATSPATEPASTARPTASDALGTLAFLRDGDVWLIDPDGSGERRLGLTGVQSFSWVSAEALDVVTGEDQSGHLLVDVEGNTTELPFPAGGSWSRDGTRYVVPVDEQVVVFNRDGSEAARLDVEPPVVPVATGTSEKPPAPQCGTPVPGSSQPDRLVFSRPEFSPNGESILVAVNCESRAGAVGSLPAPLLRVSLADGTQRQTDLQVELEDGPAATFAPDGSAVAQAIRFHGNACASTLRLFVADAAGANARELAVAAVEALPQQPGSLIRGGVVGYDWSPNSDAVVASVNASICDPSGQLGPVVQGLYLLPLDGAEELLLDEVTHSPAWSPSGGHIAYVVQESFGEVTEPPLLRVFDLTTREVIDLGDGEQPAWQPR